MAVNTSAVASSPISHPSSLSCTQYAAGSVAVAFTPIQYHPGLSVPPNPIVSVVLFAVVATPVLSAIKGAPEGLLPFAPMVVSFAQRPVLTAEAARPVIVRARAPVYVNVLGR
jgi:hypothetical protein